MAIDKSGKWWVGSEPQDVEEYLRAYSSEGYKTDEFRLAKCGCGSVEFELWADDTEGVARRACRSCGTERFIGDSEEFWSDATPEEFKCGECGSKCANVGVGFSLYEDGEVRWLYVGERCSSCGVLGCFAGWKVGYAPSRQLMDQV
jgi:hypothetical protein